MFKKIINSICSNIISPVGILNIQVHEKSLSRDCNIMMFGLFSYQYWKDFPYTHKEMLSDFHEISTSPLYKSIKENPYTTWLFINILFTSTYFVEFMKITKPPSRLHDELFNSFYKSGVKEAINRDDYYSKTSPHTEDEIKDIIDIHMRYGLPIYHESIDKNKENNFIEIDLIYKSLCSSFNINPHENMNEEMVFKEVLVKYKLNIVKRIHSEFHESNSKNDVF